MNNNYYYIWFIIIVSVSAFCKLNIKNIIFGRSVFSSILNGLNNEICSPSNLCIVILNTDEHNYTQMIYTTITIYLINYAWTEHIINEKDYKLYDFINYNFGRRIANSLLIIWTFLFIKNVNPVF